MKNRFKGIKKVWNVLSLLYLFLFSCFICFTYFMNKMSLNETINAHVSGYFIYYTLCIYFISAKVYLSQIQRGKSV